MSDSPESTAEQRPKVARLIEEYGLEGVGAEMAERWTSDGRDGMSLRELETFFNERLLETRMRSVGLQSLDGEVANLYRLLTADDVSRAERTRVTRRLERAGVDVEQLRSDFVSYQAIRTYLKEYRETTYPHDDGAPKESAKRLITQMRTRTSSIAENKLEQLAKRDDFDIANPNVYVDVRVTCGECSTQHLVEDLLESDGCDCQRGDSE